MRTEINAPRRQPAAILILAGDALVIVGWFSPWLHLYTSFSDGDIGGDQLVGPLTVLHWSAERSVQDASWYAIWLFLPYVGLVASSVASLLVRTPALRTTLTRDGIFLAGWCLIGAVAFLVVAPQSLGLSWPYFAIRGVEYGAAAGTFGFVCVLLGLVAYLLDNRGQRWEAT